MFYNVIIGSIVFLFSWAKVSKDVEEQTQLASKTKTAILAVLTFFVWTVFIKTYQVSTLTNVVCVNDYRYCADSTGNNIDTIKVIRITNQFSSGFTENREENKVKKTNDDCSFIEMGSMYIAHSWSNDNNNYKYNLDNIHQQGQDTLFGKFLNIPIRETTHVYEVNYTRTSVPSMIPLLPSFYIKKDLYFENNGYKGIQFEGDFYSIKVDGNVKVNRRSYKSDGSIEDFEGNDKAFENAYVCGAFVVDTTKNDSIKTVFYDHFTNIANTFNFFTAADISQYSVSLDIKSNCYVEKVIFMYDIPIEINPYDSSMVTTSHSFSVQGKYLNDNIVKGEGTVFHVKLPTLENLQLIRSLILTTILTALVVLLFSNVYYLIRKYSIKYLEENKERINVEKLNNFKNKIYILLSLFFIFLIYLIWKIMNDESCHIPMSFYSFLWQYYVYVIIGFIVLIIALICFLFRNVVVRKRDKKKK